MSPFLHDADVVQRGVGALAVLDGINEAVSELLDGAQQILLDEVHHAVVCVCVGEVKGGEGGREESHKSETRAGESETESRRAVVQLGGLTFNEVVLQRRPGQHHPPPRPDGVHGF